MRYDIHSVIFDVCVKHQLIEEYIYNRYRGFISTINDKNNYISYKVIDVLLKDIMVLHKEIIEKNLVVNSKISDCHIYNDDSVYLAKIANKHYIVYKKNQKTIELYIDEFDADKNTIMYIAVQLCDVIHYILYRENIAIIHASASTFQKDDSNGIAFLGDSGSGKTSIALKMIECGEKIINDDTLYINADTLIGTKNTQAVGLHNNNININFNYLRRYDFINDVLDLDKVRVDIYKNNPKCYADSIYIDKYLFIMPEKCNDAYIVPMKKIDVYRYLIRSIPRLAGILDVYSFDLISKIVLKTECYKLVASSNVNKTIHCIYSYFSALK